MAKTFGATRALRDASFELRAGEVHALVGENGSGKSTLVKIFSGVHSSDSGEFRLDGEEVRLRTPRAAQASGIVTVFQEVLVTEAQSVLDNVWLGIDQTWRTKISPREKRSRARAALDELLGRVLPLSTPVEELSLSDRQACSIVRALLRNPRILILDEATSALDVATRDRLFAIMTRLAGEGVGVIFITHRMDELSVIGDRITVMRSGDTVATLERGKWTSAELVRLMTGSDRLAEQGRAEAESLATRRGDPVLSARGLRLRPGGQADRPRGPRRRADRRRRARGARSERVPRGPVGRGSGRGGGGPPRGRARGHDPLAPARRPARHRVRPEGAPPGLALRVDVDPRELRAADAGAGRAHGVDQPARRRGAALEAYISRLGIVLGDPEDAITTLSGGNQQKVVIARWLASGPEVLLLNDPTRGIDIGAKNDLYGLLGALAASGSRWSCSRPRSTSTSS